VSAIETPIALEYGAEKPVVYALEALPLYEAIARMKVPGHWPTVFSPASQWERPQATTFTIGTRLSSCAICRTAYLSAGAKAGSDRHRCQLL